MAQSLRLVTILFTDIVGSTQIAQRVDAEDMLELSSAALARLAAVVETHGGRVLRFTGDGLKAVFGADAVAEDDAQRAVVCGLAMQAAARASAAEWQQRCPGAELAIRVGIHSGAVALGGGIEGGATAMGSAVNLAARMEQAGPPGAVRISHDSYAQVRGLFDVQEQPPLVAKGVAAPVKSYLVLRARPRAFFSGARGVEGVATKMVGRQAELALLQQAALQLHSLRALATVTVLGDAGVGKSRLLREFEAWRLNQPEPLNLLRGRATPQTQGQPFGLLRDILAWHWRIADDDSVATARSKVEAAVMPLFVHDDGADRAASHAHLLGHLIGMDWRDSVHLKGILDDPQQIRSRALHAAFQCLRRAVAASGTPTVLVLEDLHGADNESLDFLGDMTQVNHDVPLLMLAFSRATLFERRPDWMGVGGQHHRVELQPLDAAASQQLADELLQKLPEIPPGLRDMLTHGAEGNPFYMEELVNMLIDQGAIRVGDNGSPHWAPGDCRPRVCPPP